MPMSFYLESDPSVLLISSPALSALDVGRGFLRAVGPYGPLAAALEALGPGWEQKELRVVDDSSGKEWRNCVFVHRGEHFEMRVT